MTQGRYFVMLLLYAFYLVPRRERKDRPFNKDYATVSSLSFTQLADLKRSSGLFHRACSCRHARADTSYRSYSSRSSERGDHVQKYALRCHRLPRVWKRPISQRLYFGLSSGLRISCRAPRPQTRAHGRGAIVWLPNPLPQTIANSITAVRQQPPQFTTHARIS